MRSQSVISLPTIGRFVSSFIVCVTGLVAVVPHETALMWKTSVLISELGHWLGLMGVVLLLAWKQLRRDRLAAALTLTGIALLFVPLFQAFIVAGSLQKELHKAFGVPPIVEMTEPSPRPKPLVASQLLLGVPSHEVIIDEHVYDVVDGKNITLDLYRPAYGIDSRPVVVIIHGGGWTEGSKRDFPRLSRYLAARGYIVASIDYRLAPKWKFPSPQEDLQSAIRYIKDLETTHAVDPTRFVLLGRSVGAQIAMLGAYGSNDNAIRGVISLYGPSALHWGYRNPAKPRIIDSSRALEDYLGGPPTTHTPQYDAAEPARFVTRSSPPTLFIQGLRDEHVAPFHADFVSASMIDKHVPHFVLRLPWATHGCDYVFSGPCGQITTYAVEQFLASVLHPTTLSASPEEKETSP